MFGAVAAMMISIHALLAESDGVARVVVEVEVISIHALLAESDRLLVYGFCFDKGFLSTLSLRRATVGSSYVLPISY